MKNSISMHPSSQTTNRKSKRKFWARHWYIIALTIWKHTLISTPVLFFYFLQHTWHVIYSTLLHVNMYSLLLFSFSTLPSSVFNVTPAWFQSNHSSCLIMKCISKLINSLKISTQVEKIHEDIIRHCTTKWHNTTKRGPNGRELTPSKHLLKPLTKSSFVYLFRSLFLSSFG